MCRGKPPKNMKGWKPYRSLLASRKTSTRLASIVGQEIFWSGVWTFNVHRCSLVLGPSHSLNTKVVSVAPSGGKIVFRDSLMTSSEDLLLKLKKAVKSSFFLIFSWFSVLQLFSHAFTLSSRWAFPSSTIFLSHLVMFLGSFFSYNILVFINIFNFFLSCCFSFLANYFNLCSNFFSCSRILISFSIFLW